MTEHKLLTQQRNDVYQAVKQMGLSADLFGWGTELIVPVASHILGDSLELRNSSYYFTFIVDEGTFHGECCPGDTDLRQHVSFRPQFLMPNETYLTGKPWQEFLRIHFRPWLVRVKAEIETPDLWGTVGQATALVTGDAPADGQNTLFTAAEQEALQNGLDEVENYILAINTLDDGTQEHVRAQLGYLKEATSRAPRFDFRNILIGVLVNIVIAAAFAPERARELFRFVTSLLPELPDIPPIPPP
jgi:hypothetical protein